MTFGADRGPPRVLVVEDEQLVSMLVEDMVEDLGCVVTAIAANLQTGLAAAADASIDFAILDVNLNGEKSFPIAETLIKRGIPFVFGSGYGLASVKENYPDVPVLQKPFLQSTLADAIERALGSVNLQ